MIPAATNDPAALRRRAEAQFKRRLATSHVRSVADLRRLQHELEVHQIELEMQNEQLRAANQETEAGLERYADLYDYAPVGYFNLSGDGAILVANLTGAKLMGIERSRLAGRLFVLLINGDDQAVFNDFFQRVLANEARQSCEVKLKRKDPPALAVRLEGTLSPDASECRIAMSDITERKAAEMAMSRLAAIVKSSDDAIMGIDLDGTITSWNQGAEKIFGYTAGEMVGISVMRLIPADGRKEEGQILVRIKRGEAMDHFETVRQARDGRLLEVSVTASPIKDTTGKVVGVSKILRDITERKRSEVKLRDLGTQLNRAEEY